jgi:hypothetical protein
VASHLTIHSIRRLRRGLIQGLGCMGRTHLSLRSLIVSCIMAYAPQSCGVSDPAASRSEYRSSHKLRNLSISRTAACSRSVFGMRLSSISAINSLCGRACLHSLMSSPCLRSNNSFKPTCFESRLNSGVIHLVVSQAHLAEPLSVFL